MADSMSTLKAYPLPSANGESAQETGRVGSFKFITRYMPKVLPRLTSLEEALHHAWVLELGGLSLLPIPPNMKLVLDVGCGTGVWSRTMATQYPDTKFIGVDVSPPLEGALQTASNSNISFVKANVEDDWSFVEEPGTVDYVFIRLLTTSIKNWQGLYDKAFAATKPGGYCESLETWIGIGSDDDEKFKDSPFLKWFGHLRDFMTSKEIETESIDTHGKRLEKAGFKILAEKPIRYYYESTRPEMKGREVFSQKFKDSMFDFLDVVTPKIFANSTAMSLEEGRKLAADARADITQNAGKAGYYTRFHVRAAQKPW